MLHVAPSPAFTPPVLDARTIRELEPILLGYARRRLGRDDLAYDVVQDTWLAAMKSLPSYAGRSTFRTWLIAILRRKIVDTYRRRRPQVSFVEEAHGEADYMNVAQRVDDERAVARVEQELATLPQKERTAITLVDVRGLERDEAADELGVTRNHLRVLLHRGRHKIRETLEKEAARAA